MKDSNIFGVSVRAWVCILLVITVCFMSAIKIDVTEPLYTLVVSVVSFYFGRNVGKQDGINKE